MDLYSLPLPPVPLPPAASQAPLAPALPQPGQTAALLALLLADGIVHADTASVDFVLSDHELIVNGEPQSATLRAKYHQHLGQAGGSVTTICLKAGE